jgi:hypothetical protein
MNDKLGIDCTMSKAAAASLIKALTDALLHESGRTDVRVRAWFEDDYRIGFKVNRDIAAWATYEEVQA